MTDESALPLDSVSPGSIRARVVQIMDTWRKGSRPDARQVLQMHPDLWSEPSAVLDLALAEYRLRRAAGEEVNATTFAAKFSTYAEDVKRILSVENAIGDLNWQVRWPEPGESYLEFKLLHVLGIGAVGRVYLARQETIGDRPVALKLTPLGCDEAQTLGRLQHANIVPVLSVHNDPVTGLAGVCMPYLGTSTLLEVVRLAWRDEGSNKNGTPPLPVWCRAVTCPQGIQPPEARCGEQPLWEMYTTYWDALIHIAAELCEGLAYVHSKGILHLDLKPSNVLLSPTGRPMLLDFNLAQDPVRRRARLGGTVPYMAPEHFQKAFLSDRSDTPDLSDLSDRSDLYSLGVVLFELCTGRLPHESTATAFDQYLEQIAISHLRGAPPVRQVNPDVPETLASLIDACLETELESRPQSAAWLRDQFLALVVRRPGQTTRRRHRRAALAVLGVAAATGVVMGGFYWYRNRPASSDPITAKAVSDDTTAPIDLNNLIAQAIRAEKEEKFAEAARLFAQIVEVDSAPLWREHYAYCLVRLERYAEARAQLGILAAHETSSARISNNVGYVLLRLGDVNRAFRYFKKAITLDESIYQPYCNILVCLSHLQDVDLADLRLVEQWLERFAVPDYRPYLVAAGIYKRMQTINRGNNEAFSGRLRGCLDKAKRLGCPDHLTQMFNPNEDADVNSVGAPLGSKSIRSSMPEGQLGLELYYIPP